MERLGKCLNWAHYQFLSLMFPDRLLLKHPEGVCYWNCWNNLRSFIDISIFFSTSELAFHSCLVEYLSEKIDKIPSRETFTAEFLFGKTLRKSKTTLWNCVNLSSIAFLNLNPNLGEWGGGNFTSSVGFHLINQKQ